MRNKLLIGLSISAVIALLASGAAYSAAGIKLIVNGNVLTREVPHQIVKGSILVPIREVSQALGADVQWKETGSTLTVNQADCASLQRQVELLQYALAPHSANEAVKAWAEAVKTRNGAAQYAVLSPELQSQLAKTYEEMNWVTGVSSPWVDSYRITDKAQTGQGQVSYAVTFVLKTSTGFAGKGTVKVHVGTKDDKWMITSLQTASGSEDLKGIVVVP